MAQYYRVSNDTSTSCLVIPQTDAEFINMLYNLRFTRILHAMKLKGKRFIQKSSKHYLRRLGDRERDFFRSGVFDRLQRQTS